MLQTISILLLLVFSAMPSHAHETVAPQDNINVVGIGEVDGEPDQAILSVSITAQESTLVAAKSAADESYRAVLKQIKASDIDDKFIKATRINAQPQYDWANSKRVYKGERVSRSLSITINDLDKVSSLMQALVDSGVSTIDGIKTGFQNPDELKQQALGIAADNAKNKAEFLAKRLDRELGQAYLISEQSGVAQPNYQPNVQMMRSSSAMQEEAPQEMFGTQVIKATVNVSFNLL